MPTDPPLVSIILIFFNEARFIAEAIESVLAQTYRHWELLLVDDGSRDASPQIAQAYTQQDPTRMRYLAHPHHENRGMSATRNLGLGQAQGDYITFIDADDVWLPDKLTQQVQILQTQPDVALVCGRTQWWYSWTRKPDDLARDFIPQVNLPLDTAIAAPQVLIQFLKDEWTSLCDVMVRRAAVEAVGGYEDRFRGMYEDQAFHAKLCLRYPTWIADTCWYRYRQHAASCCGAADTARWLATRQMYLEWLEAYLRNQPRTPVWGLVQRELWRYRAPLLFRVRRRLQQMQSIGQQLAARSISALTI
jgi:glycosyltransferase involved in cell wall biosynthesis